MIRIYYKENLSTHDWYVGEAKPPVGVILELRVTGSELEEVIKLFRNIPYTDNETVIYTGEMATFIYNNMFRA